MEFLSKPKTEIGYWLAIQELEAIIKQLLVVIANADLFSDEMDVALKKYFGVQRKLNLIMSELSETYPCPDFNNWYKKMEIVLNNDYEKTIYYIGPNKKRWAMEVVKIDPYLTVLARSKIFYPRKISFIIKIDKKPL